MSRGVLRTVLLVWLLCGLAVSGSVVMGKILPAEPAAVFLTVVPETDLRVTWMDSRVRAVYEKVLINARLPFSIDPDCRLLFPAMMGTQVRLGYLNLKTHELRLYLPGYTSFSDTDWLPDKRHVWVRYTDTRRMTHHVLLDTETGAATRLEIPVFDFVPSGYSVWSPDARYGMIYLQTIGVAAFVGIVSAETGRSIPLPVTTGLFLGDWSPDSRWLAVQNSQQNTLTIMDVTGRVQARYQFADVVDAIAPAWLSNEHILVFARRDESETSFSSYFLSVYGETAERTRLHLPANIPGREGRGSISPDGTKLAYNNENITTIYAIETGDMLTRTASASFRAAWSPDSRYLVEYEPDDDMLIITDSQARTVHRFPGWRTFPAGDWSPDNTELTLFDRPNATLGRIIFGNQDTRLEMKLHLHGAYSAAWCYP